MGCGDGPLKFGGTMGLLRPGKGPLGIPSFIWVAMGPDMFIVVTTPWDLFIEFIVFMLATVFMLPAIPALLAMLLRPIDVLVLTRLMEDTATLEAIDMDMVPVTLAAIEFVILLGILFKLFTESLKGSCWLDVGTPLMFRLAF